VHTEAVAAVIGRAELWAFLFGLLMLLLHHRRSRPWQPGACYALALLSKESALMFFPLAVVMDYLFPGDAPRWPRRHYAGYALAAAAWFGLWMTVHADAVMPPPFIDNPLVGVSLLQRICTVASIQLDYLRMLVYPVGLSSDYSYNQVPIVSTLWHPRVIGFMSVTAAALWLGWRVRGAHPAVLFGIAGYAVLFGVTSNLIQPIGTIMADRLAYAPSFGFCVAAAYGLWCAGRRLHKTALWIASGLIFMGCGWLTMDRNATWANERVFYETQVRTAPNSAKAHYNLGTVLAKAGDDAAAVKAYETALAIFPYYPEPLYNMGNALKRLNAPPERVLEAYRGAIAYDRGHREAHANLATYLLDLGRTEEARPVVDSLAALDPGFPALAPLRTRLAQAPSASQAALPPVLQQGILAYADGNHVQAIRMIKQALEEASALPPSLRKTALMILSNAYRATGDQVQADAYRRMAEDIR
jgi:tetratricopeptide (TPR) repeat protein